MKVSKPVRALYCSICDPFPAIECSDPLADICNAIAPPSVNPCRMRQIC